MAAQAHHTQCKSRATEVPRLETLHYLSMYMDFLWVGGWVGRWGGGGDPLVSHPLTRLLRLILVNTVLQLIAPTASPLI